MKLLLLKTLLLSSFSLIPMSGFADSSDYACPDKTASKYVWATGTSRVRQRGQGSASDQYLINRARTKASLSITADQLDEPEACDEGCIDTGIGPVLATAERDGQIRFSAGLSQAGHRCIANANRNYRGRQRQNEISRCHARYRWITVVGNFLFDAYHTRGCDVPEQEPAQREIPTEPPLPTEEGGASSQSQNETISF